MNQKDYISLDTIQSELKDKSVRSGFSLMTVELIKLLVRISSTMIFARLLIPEEFGLVAMVSSVIGFAHVFKNMGLSSTTIQKRNITIEQVNTLFWINFGIGLILMLLVVSISPIIANFYDEPRLTKVTLLLSLPFLFNGISVQHMALLKRQMLFKNIALVEIISIIIGTLTGIILAIYGYSYWALVSISVITSASMTVGVWIACRWRPSRFSFAKGTKSLIKFGKNIASFNIINYFARKMDNVLIGKYIGSESLGIYNKAYNLLLLPINQIRNPIVSVALPALSSLQSSPTKFSEYYRRIVFLISFLSMPIMAFVFVFADNIVLIMLGDNWSPAIPIIKILAISAFIQPVSGTKGVVMISTGMSKKYFIIGLVNSVLVVSSFIVGLHWGIIGVAIAFAIINYLFLLPSLYYSFRNTPVTVGDFFKSILIPTFTSILMAGLLVIVHPLFESMNCVLEIFVLIFTAFTIYVGLWAIFPRGRVHLYDIWEYVKIILRRK